MSSATNDPLSAYRSYLLMLARAQLAHRLRQKLDASDIVQETLLKAHASAEQFRGKSPAEKAAWLRAILANTLAEALRKFSGPERNIDLEQSLEATSWRLEAWLVDANPSPGGKLEQDEQLLRLADALERLPAAERTALELKYLQGCPAAEIASILERTPIAVYGLLRRGVAHLRQALSD